MNTNFASVAALFLLAVAGCGGTSVLPPSKPIVPPAPVTPSVLAALPGDWIALVKPVAATTPVLPTPIASFSGALTVTGTTITGTFRAFAPDFAGSCPSLTAALPVSGTLDANNNLTLTGTVSGGTVTITAALPQNLHAYIPGSYQIVGGTCPVPATAIDLAQFAPVTGTYTGTYNANDPATNAPIPDSATTITAVLTQSTIPSVDGDFLLTGTVTSKGACTGQLPIDTGSVSGGGIFSHSLLGTSSVVGSFNGAINPSATTLIGNFYLLRTCPNQVYLGTLIRQ